MIFLNPNVKYLPQGNTIDDLYKHMEICGRVCYKSFDKITNESAKKFIDRIINSKHGTVLEHGTVYLAKEMDYGTTDYVDFEERYSSNKYSKINYEGGIAYATTNYRVLIEHNWLEDLQYICEPTEYHEKRLTFMFNTDIGISREYNRHRTNSVNEQSTRYCNYSKDKFHNSLTISTNTDITTVDIDTSLDKYNSFENICKLISDGSFISDNPVDYWLFAQMASEYAYMNLIRCGWKAEQARRVLTLSTSTEYIHTAFVSDWIHFISLRSKNYGAQGVHPDATVLADSIYQFLKEQHYVE